MYNLTSATIWPWSFPQVAGLRGRSRAIEHIGSSHDDVELELLKASG